jgi:hypothetical protein
MQTSKSSHATAAVADAWARYVAGVIHGPKFM